MISDDFNKFTRAVECIINFFSDPARTTEQLAQESIYGPPLVVLKDIKASFISAQAALQAKLESIESASDDKEQGAAWHEFMAVVDASDNALTSAVNTLQSLGWGPTSDLNGVLILKSTIYEQAWNLSKSPEGNNKWPSCSSFTSSTSCPHLF